MSEIGETFALLKDGKRALRAKYGRDCPKCRELRPRANPSLLLPGQRCKVDGYRDPRPRITDFEFETVTGFEKIYPHK